MKTVVFDIETFSLYANTGILLCAVCKEVGHGGKIKVFRADDYPQWKTNHSNSEPIVRALTEYLVGNDEPDSGFDIFVAHNGVYFDRAMLTTWALRYNIPAALRFAKFIDPVLLLRRHCRLTRNSLNEAISYFKIPHKKTPIDWDHWMLAAFEKNRESLNYIVEHCIADVKALEALHNITKRLVKGIDEKGSSF